MTNRKYAAFNYPKDCITEDKRRTMALNHRYNAANFRIPFRINWAVILIVISICQFTESVAERQVSVSINNMSNITFTYFLTLYYSKKKR